MMSIIAEFGVGKSSINRCIGGRESIQIDWHAACVAEPTLSDMYIYSLVDTYGYLKGYLNYSHDFLAPILCYL